MVVRVGIAYRVFAKPSGANDDHGFELGTLLIEANANRSFAAAE